MRRRIGWDLLGLSLSTLAMLAVHLAATAALGRQIGHPAGAGPAAVAAAAFSLVLLVFLTVRDRAPARDLPRLVARVWIDPPGPWVAAPLGALVAVPLLGLYTPVLLRDADSARVVAAVDHVRTHGIGFLVDTQDNFLPHVVLGPVVHQWGLSGVKVVTILSVMVLAAVTAYVTRRITGSLGGAAAAAVALVALPPVVDRAGFVPMYPLMLALGYLGSWLAYRAIVQPGHRWAWAAAAGSCLALAPEAQAVGQLFLAAPVVLAVFAPDWRRWLAACVRIYVCVALVSVPRIVVNLWEGGLDRFTSFRTDYWITEGYVADIQTQFWAYEGVNEPLKRYLAFLPERFADTLEPQGRVVLGLALAAWLVACRVRGRLLVMGAVGVMVAAVSVKQVPPFPRYYSPLWPGLAILVGVGVAALARRRRWTTTALATVTVLALVGLAASALMSVIRIHDARRAVVEGAPFRELADAIDDDRGVVGARSHGLVNVTARVPTWGGQFLTEDEYVTFLTWPSDAAVIEVMERHDIGWVLVQPNRDLETRYHDTWLIPAHGRPARHVDRVAESPRFCLDTEISGYKLYRLGGCPRAARGPLSPAPPPPGTEPPPLGTDPPPVGTAPSPFGTEPAPPAAEPAPSG